MAVTQAQTIDTYLGTYPNGTNQLTTAGWLSYVQNGAGTGVQQHPGNGVSLSTADGGEAQRFSVAKTSHSYSPNGLNEATRCGSRIYSLTPNMRQAYAAAGIAGARSLDRPRLASTAGACA
jgi:hypothetical protein